MPKFADQSKTFEEFRAVETPPYWNVVSSNTAGLLVEYTSGPKWLSWLVRVFTGVDEMSPEWAMFLLNAAGVAGLVHMYECAAKYVGYEYLSNEGFHIPLDRLVQMRSGGHLSRWIHKELDPVFDRYPQMTQQMQYEVVNAVVQDFKAFFSSQIPSQLFVVQNDGNELMFFGRKGRVCAFRDTALRV